MSVPLGHGDWSGWPREKTAQTWLEDLAWHKNAYHGSQFVWWDEHVMRIVTSLTGGQLDFTNVAHLRSLQRILDEHFDYTQRCRFAIAAPMLAAHTMIGKRAVVCEQIGMAETDYCSILSQSVDFTAEQLATPDVRWIRRGVEAMVFKNPLILAWELKQMWLFHSAVCDVLEDAVIDLVEELIPTRPMSVLAEAAHTVSVRSLEIRIERARDERGRVGDSRRKPVQRH